MATPGSSAAFEPIGERPADVLRADQIEFGGLFPLGRREQRRVEFVDFIVHFRHPRESGGPASFSAREKRSGIPASAGMTE